MDLSPFYPNSTVCLIPHMHQLRSPVRYVASSFYVMLIPKFLHIPAQLVFAFPPFVCFPLKTVGHEIGFDGAKTLLISALSNLTIHFVYNCGNCMQNTVFVVPLQLNLPVLFGSDFCCLQLLWQCLLACLHACYPVFLAFTYPSS